MNNIRMRDNFTEQEFSILFENIYYPCEAQIFPTQLVMM